MHAIDSLIGADLVEMWSNYSDAIFTFCFYYFSCIVEILNKIVYYFYFYTPIF